MHGERPGEAYVITIKDEVLIRTNLGKASELLQAMDEGPVRDMMAEVLKQIGRVELVSVVLHAEPVKK